MLCSLFSVLGSGCGGSSGDPDAGPSADASGYDVSVVDGHVRDEGSEDASADEGTEDASVDGDVVDTGVADAEPDAPSTTARLTVVFEGDGHGRVTSADPVFSCSDDCAMDFPFGTALSLVALREDDSTYDRFWGPCTEVNGTCTLTLDQDATIHVEFDGIHNYAFVTSERFAPSELDGALEADALCNAAAAAGDERLHGRTYVAWVSDSSSDARDRLGAASGWQRLDGLPFIASRETMVGSSTAHVLYPPRLDEHGADVLPPNDGSDPTGGTTYFATGIGLSGEPGENCNDWSSASGSFAAGAAHSAGVNWTSDIGAACGISARLLCLGSDFATPFLPLTPPTGATRAVFATSVPIGMSGQGRSVLDARCQEQAEAAGLTGTYLALLAAPGASALSRFSATGGPWVRMDGVTVVRDPSSFLTTGVPDSALGTFTRDGGATRNGFATGAPNLTTAGTDETTCMGYASADSDNYFSYSQAGTTYPALLGLLGVPCSSFYSIVCMAQ